MFVTEGNVRQVEELDASRQQHTHLIFSERQAGCLLLQLVGQLGQVDGGAEFAVRHCLG